MGNWCLIVERSWSCDVVSVYESFFASLLRLVGAMGVHVASFLACCISRVPNVCFCKVLDILLIGLGSRI